MLRKFLMREWKKLPWGYNNERWDKNKPDEKNDEKKSTKVNLRKKPNENGGTKIDRWRLPTASLGIEIPCFFINELVNVYLQCILIRK